MGSGAREGGGGGLSGAVVTTAAETLGKIQGKFKVRIKIRGRFAENSYDGWLMNRLSVDDRLFVHSSPQSSRARRPIIQRPARQKQGSSRVFYCPTSSLLDEDGELACCLKEDAVFLAEAAAVRSSTFVTSHATLIFCSTTDTTAASAKNNAGFLSCKAAGQQQPSSGGKK